MMARAGEQLSPATVDALVLGGGAVMHSMEEMCLCLINSLLPLAGPMHRGPHLIATSVD
jgi:hypothetical protein